MIKNLDTLANSSSISVLLRHAKREEIPSGSYGNDVSLTKEGRQSCKLWYKKHKSYLSKIYTSSVKRCLESAKLISGSDFQIPIEVSSLLGNPGAFVHDSKQLQDYFLKNTLISIANILLSSSPNPAGFCKSTFAAINDLLTFIHESANNVGLYAFITHDNILAILLGYFFPSHKLEVLWPNYLEGLYLYWPSNDCLQLSYRDHLRIIPWPLLKS